MDNPSTTEPTQGKIAMAYPLKTLAIVYFWPGVKTSELDIMRRIRDVCSSRGIEVCFVSPTGQLLDENGCYRKPQIVLGDPTFSSIDAVLYLHFLAPKFLDAVSFLTNWNPVDFILKDPITKEDMPPAHLRLVRTTLQSMDCILSADSPSADSFAKACLRIPFAPPCSMKWGSFHTTCQVEDSLSFPSLEDFSVFYIAANWEKQRGVSRFGSLTELLDHSGKFSFFGIRRHGGVDVWEGIKSYRGELPFDGGKSIIRESNKCGVTLVLHSREHHNEAVVSTRIFQACAAKTVIICDDNPWIVRNFGDSVLTIHQDHDNPQNTAQAILDAVDWIEKNKTEALVKARRAHEIFLNRFSLEKEIESLVNKFGEIACANAECRPRHASVDVLWRYERHRLATFVEDLGRQTSVSVRAIVLVRDEHAGEAEKLLRKTSLRYHIVREPAGHRLGDAVREAILHEDAASAITIYMRHTRWFSNHLLSLCLQLDAGYHCAQSGTFSRNTEFRHFDSTDYYQICQASANEGEQALSMEDVALFRADKFMPSAFLFGTQECRSLGDRLNEISFFGPGCYLYLVSLFLQEGFPLPAHTGKLTNLFERIGNEWFVDNYYNSNISLNLERGVFRTFSGGEWLRCGIYGSASSLDTSAPAPAGKTSLPAPFHPLSFPLKRKRPATLIEWLRARRRDSHACDVLRKSGLISEEFYRKQVANLPAGVDCVTHYVLTGSYDGVNPCEDFDTKYYWSANQDVLTADVNPLLHFLEHGYAEGRNPSPALSGAEIMTNASLAKISSLCAFLRNRKDLS